MALLYLLHLFAIGMLVNAQDKPEDKPDKPGLPCCSYHNGTLYSVGDSWPAIDGCNTCHCLDDGTVACTKIGCLPNCDYSGQTYQPGDEWLSDDGCNTCSCSPAGVVCTEKLCTGCTYRGMTYAEGEHFPSMIDCNECWCENGEVPCTKINCPYCEDNGVYHPPGSTWTRLDCCNTCQCFDGGKMTCTKKLCPACEYDCKQYSIGDMIRHKDGCNICYCLGKDRVECTEKTCENQCCLDGVVYKSGGPYEDPKDPCKFHECTAGNVLVSYARPCEKPKCKNPVSVKGCCCPVCPGECCANFNEIFKDGEDNVDPDKPCDINTCSKGEWLTAIRDCPQPQCDNPVQIPGQCCRECQEKEKAKKEKKAKRK